MPKRYDITLGGTIYVPDNIHSLGDDAVWEWIGVNWSQDEVFLHEVSYEPDEDEESDVVNLEF